MSIELLSDGQKVRARFGRAGAEDVIWGAWKEVTLSVQRNKKGEIAFIGVRGLAWAEYTPADYDPQHGFLAEHYYMQIETD